MQNLEKTTQPSSTRGFSLVELLVVITVVIIIISVVLFSGRRGRVATDVQNAAQGLALAIQEIQAYSLGVRNKGTLFEGAYGINFSQTDDRSVDATDFVLFVDVDNDFHYDVSSDEVIETITLPDNVELKNITRIGGGSGPSSTSPGPGGKGFSIVFKRPNSDALMHLIQNGSQEFIWTGAVITFKSVLDPATTASITVLDTGHVRVE